MGRKTKKGPTKLTDLEINSVDFVPAGMNQEAYIEFFKGRGEGDELAPEPSKIEKFFYVIAKKLGFSNSEMEEIEKAAQSFTSFTQQQEKRRIDDEIWDYTSALRDSWSSILNDRELDISQASQAMKQSLDEFVDAVSNLLPKWAVGESTIAKGMDEETLKLCKMKEIEALEERIAVLKSDMDDEDDEDGQDDDEKPKSESNQSEGRGVATTEKPEPTVPEVEIEDTEGGKKMKKINKSLLTPEENAAFEAILAKAGYEEPTPSSEGVVKGADGEAPLAQPTAAAGDDIFKGLPAGTKEAVEAIFQKQFDELATLKKSLEMKELEAVAKKYELLGKDSAQLAETLYGMKQAGESVYKGYIAALDDSLSIVEKSGLFTEVGKGSRGQDNVQKGVLAKIEEAAAEIKKGNPELSYVQAMDKAWEANPDLAKAYDQEYEGRK